MGGEFELDDRMREIFGLLEYFPGGDGDYLDIECGYSICAMC